METLGAYDSRINSLDLMRSLDSRELRAQVAHQAAAEADREGAGTRDLEDVQRTHLPGVSF